MAKYFVRYGYDISHKIPNGDGLGWKYETDREESSCIFEMDDDLVDIENIQKYIYNYDLNWQRGNRPESYLISILVLNKL